MDTLKCEECNMKFTSKLLFENHKKKFCGALGEPPGPTPPRTSGSLENMQTYRGRMSGSPKQSLPPYSPESRLFLHSSRSNDTEVGQSSMSELEKDKVEQLKALKASKSLQRSLQHLGVRSVPIHKLDSRLSRPSSYDLKDRPLLNEQLKQLQINHREQLEQLQAHNERLQQEKIEIQERMNSLGLKSRQRLPSQGSVIKQADELDGLKRFLGYQSNQISNDYKTEMKKLNDLKKTFQSAPNVTIQPSPLPTPRYNSPSRQEAKSSMNVDNVPPVIRTPPQVIVGNPSLYDYNTQSDQTGIMAEINAIKLSYLQGGGRDPAILSQIAQLEREATSIQPVSKSVGDPVVQQQIMEYHLANQKLEHELQLLRMEKQQNEGHRKTPELSPEFQRHKIQHLEKMTELKQESEMLKQLTEIEKMKRELEELRGEKTVETYPGAKQTHQMPFLMSTSGADVSLKPSPYDPSAGFSVFWDFILGLQSSCTNCRLAVGIYNGNELLSDVKVLPMVSVAEYQQRSLPSGGVAMLGITHPFPKCAPLQTLSLVAELQANSVDKKENPQKLFSRGWTKMDLFDLMDRLISGRWKIPFRVPPIKTYLSSHELNRIPQVGTAELYIRLVNARDVQQEEIVTPHPGQHYTYSYPSLDNQSLHKFSGHRVISIPSTAAENDGPPLPPPSVPPPPDTPNTVSLTSIREPSPDSSVDQSILGIVIDQLNDAIDGEIKLKITAYDGLDGEILKAAGDTPVMCVTKSCKQDFIKDTYVFGLQEALFRHVPWNRKSFVIIRLYLQPVEQGKNQTGKLLADDKLAAWTVIPLAVSDQRGSRQGRESSVQLNAGKHCVPLYFPPVADVTSLSTDVNYSAEGWTKYGRAILQMAIFSGFRRPLEKSTSPDEFIDENELPKDAWIKNGRSSIASEEFNPGSGFDLYVDGARFLPDSVTYTKVAGRVMDKSYSKIGPDVEVQSKLYSDIYNPEYDCRLEFREPVFPITSMLVVKVYTVDRVSKKMSCIGFSVLPIFLMLGTITPPTNNSDSDKVALNDGAHQLRIYNGSPDFSQPLGTSVVSNLDPVPCASLLVRIVRAVCHPNGKPKEISQFQEREWESEGLVVTKPRYEEGSYYSLSCEPSLGECQIINNMVSRQPVTVRDSIQFTAVGQDRHIKKDEVISSWIKTQLTRGIDVAPPDFDLNYVSLYHPMHGLKVSVDGAQNLPWANFSFATFCLSPPASFYMGEQADPLELTTYLDFASNINSPVWLDGLKCFPRRLYHRYLTLVVHVREALVNFSGSVDKYELKGQAWTVLQIFQEGYVLNGSYQLPLFQGEPTQPILNELQRDNFQEVIAAFRRKKLVKYLEGSSVFVRISDARRDDELPKAVTKAKQDYLPKDRLDRYTSINPSKELSSLLSPGLSEVDFALTFSKKVNESMSQVFVKNVKEIAEKEAKK